MNPLTSLTAAPVVLLTASTAALAHGDGPQSHTIYHYMSSPDHIMFSALMLVALGTGAWALRSGLTSARQKKR